MSLSYIGEELTVYGGYFILFTGVIGNGMNIIVFLTMRTYRTTPCTFYFLVGSIDNFIYLSMILTTRILSVGYNDDLTRTSIICCKIRNFFIYSLSLITLTCSSLATIDQYLITSQNANLRRYSNIKLAHRIMFIFIIIWCLHAIPAAVFREILPASKTCANANAQYAIYISIYLIGLLCTVPISIMIIFGYLTYRNIRLTRVLARQGADRQTTQMTLVLVVLNIICLLPYGVNNTYQTITSGVVKDANRVLNESFATTIVTLISYFYYTGSCYVFIISSRRFRRAVKDRLFLWRHVNQINPLEQREM